ncbi:MAG: Rpn family recombination-promoting nuclease/putative transposase, partial [Muribaculaceae bacterium]|nr:Rpn family recombination-promoting nuclease/putative transposase [Muribaculaceae bacterium]
MSKYIDPTYDAGFKLTFGRENVSEELLIGILNALLCGNDGFEEIVSVTYLNNERGSEWMDGKGIRYDILCETSSHHRFIVEMQKAHQPHFIDRASFYVARGIAEQGYKGKDEEDVAWDYDLKPVIGVFLCNFNIRTLEPKVVVRARVLDEESHKPIGDKTRYYFIQLPQFVKSEAECENLLDMWLYNIKNMGMRQEVAFMRDNEIFRRLEKVTSVAALTPEERRSYEADVKNARDTLNQIRGARMEGRAEGLAEGLEKGLAEGRAEERLDMARKMKRNGMP